MAFIRTVLFFVVLVVTVIPYTIGVTCMSIAPLRLRYRVAVWWLQIATWAAKAVCGMRYEVRGFEILEKLARENTAVVLAPKHQSTWETFALPSISPRPLCFVYKRELNWVPFFGWSIAQLRMIHIDRNKGMQAFEQVVEQGAQRLAEGRWIIVFPEGTRTRVGARTKYKSGASRLAVRTGAVVVPIAVNSGELWPKHRFVKTPGTITLSIGPPITSSDKTVEQVNALVQTWIEAEMRRISPHVYRDAVAAADTAPHQNA